MNISKTFIFILLFLNFTFASQTSNINQLPIEIKNQVQQAAKKTVDEQNPGLSDLHKAAIVAGVVGIALISIKLWRRKNPGKALTEEQINKNVKEAFIKQKNDINNNQEYNTQNPEVNIKQNFVQKKQDNSREKLLRENSLKINNILNSLQDKINEYKKLKQEFNFGQNIDKITQKILERFQDLEKDLTESMKNDFININKLLANINSPQPEKEEIEKLKLKYEQAIKDNKINEHDVNLLVKELKEKKKNALMDKLKNDLYSIVNSSDFDKDKTNLNRKIFDYLNFSNDYKDFLKLEEPNKTLSNKLNELNKNIKNKCEEYKKNISYKYFLDQEDIENIENYFLKLMKEDLQSSIDHYKEAQIKNEKENKKNEEEKKRNNEIKRIKEDQEPKLINELQREIKNYNDLFKKLKIVEKTDNHTLTIDDLIKLKEQYDCFKPIIDKLNIIYPDFEYSDKYEVIKNQGLKNALNEYDKIKYNFDRHLTGPYSLSFTGQVKDFLNKTIREKTKEKLGYEKYSDLILKDKNGQFKKANSHIHDQYFNLKYENIPILEMGIAKKYKGAREEYFKFFKSKEFEDIFDKYKGLFYNKNDDKTTQEKKIQEFHNYINAKMNEEFNFFFRFPYNEHVQIEAEKLGKNPEEHFNDLMKKAAI